jgi:DNA polymerase III epsilon subunit-like protein
MNNYLILDTETAGLSGGVCEIAWVTMDENLNILEQHETLVDPERQIEPGAFAIHGISNEMCVGKPKLADVAKLLPESGWMVAHNCVTPDHEVLTKQGWVAFADLQGETVEALVWDQSENLQWAECPVIRKPYKGPVLEYDTQYHCGVYTPEHRVAFSTASGLKNPSGRVWSVSTVEDFALRGPNSCVFPAAGLLNPEGVGKSAPLLRLLEAIRADANTQQNASGSYMVRFNLKKERKKVRLRGLLTEAGLTWVEAPRKGDTDVTSFSIHASPDRDWIVDTLGLGKAKSYGPWVLKLSLAEKLVLLDEIEHWDGTKPVPGAATRGKIATRVTTQKRVEAEWLQVLATTAGKTAKLQTEKPNTRGFSRPDGVLSSVTLRANPYIKTLEHPSRRDYDGSVYCLNTPTGFFMVRRKGCVWVTGNCQFDTRMIASVYTPAATLCTLALSRKYITGTTNHKLATLQSELGLPDRKSHSALGDILTVHDLLQVILPKTGTTLEALFKRASTPKMLHVMPFGKHKGVPILNVPADYRNWLMGQAGLDQDLKYTLEKMKNV